MRTVKLWKRRGERENPSPPPLKRKNSIIIITIRQGGGGKKEAENITAQRQFVIKQEDQEDRERERERERRDSDLNPQLPIPDPHFGFSSSCFNSNFPKDVLRPGERGAGRLSLRVEKK